MCRYLAYPYVKTTQGFENGIMLAVWADIQIYLI